MLNNILLPKMCWFSHFAKLRNIQWDLTSKITYPNTLILPQAAQMGVYENQQSWTSVRSQFKVHTHN